MNDEISALEPLERIEKLQEMLKERENLRNDAEKEITEIKKHLEKAAFEVDEIRKDELEEHHAREQKEKTVPEQTEIGSLEQSLIFKGSQSLEQQVMHVPVNSGLQTEQNLYKLVNPESIDRLEYLQTQAVEGQNWSSEDYNFFKEAKAEFQGVNLRDASQDQKENVVKGQSILDQIDKYKKGL